MVILLALVTLAAFLVPQAWAQEAGQLTVARLEVSLWPEFDDPRLLVLYRGQFAEVEAFPREISFRIPRTAEVHATAYADEQGQLMANPFDLQLEGDEQVVTYPIPTASFHFEFYDDVIQGEPASRRFEFTLSLPYPVQSLRVDAQEPLRATDFQVSPVASRIITGTDGFRYFTYDLGGLELGQSVKITAAYAKPDARPSVEVTPAPLAPGPLRAAEGEAGGGTQPLLLIAAAGLGGVGLALMAGALLMRRRSVRPAPARQRAFRPVVPVKPQVPPRARATAAFCTECGQRLSPGARFCPECGTPARVLEDEVSGEPAAAGESLSFRARVANDLVTLRVSRRVLGLVLVAILVVLALVLGWWLGQQTAARSVGWLMGVVALG